MSLTRWRVKYTEEARSELFKLDKPVRERIRSFVKRLPDLPNPRMRGEALQGPLSGLWKYRVGDYRLVCQIQDEVVTVLIVWLGHRREVYRTH